MGKVKTGDNKARTEKKGMVGKQVRFNEAVRTTSPTDGPMALADNKHSAGSEINPFPLSRTHWFDHDSDDDESESSRAFGRAHEYAASEKEAHNKKEIERVTGNIMGPYARSPFVAANTDANAIRVAKKVKLFQKTVKRVERVERARSARNSKVGKGVLKRRQTKKRK